MYKISVIIPLYNALNTINHTIQSVINQTIGFSNIELIIVDDCSTDGGYEFIQEYYSNYSNIKLLRLEKNSGSPSTPRNIALKNATSEYIMFLDADDELPPTACVTLYQEASIGGYDCVRGNLLVIKDDKEYIANKLSHEISGIQAVEQIIKKQSTTIDGIYKLKYFGEGKVNFLPDVKIGEDTIILTKYFSLTQKVKYINQVTYKYIRNTSINSFTSTQSYGVCELKNHLYVWNCSEENLQKINLSYYKLRLSVALKVTLENIIKYNTPLDKELFDELSRLVINTQKYIKKYNFNERVLTIYQSLLSADYERFCSEKKPHLLIAGYDLKFTKDIARALSDKYNIKFDEWQGHNKHSEKKSKELLAWADIIWCEWMLGNAVWYSNHKKSHQTLFIRLHRFEITRDFYKSVNHTNVDFYTMVGHYFYEKFIEVMSLDRDKCYLIPNAIDFDGYKSEKNKGFNKNIALVGSLPKRKGLDKAITVLKNLPEDFQLFIFGKKYLEVPWILADKNEFEYYEQTEEMIENYNLSSGVHYLGWVDTKEALKNIGYVLSVSDDEEYPESFHLAPLEGLASGALCCCLNWRGIEYVYPNELIMNSTKEISDFIIKTSTDEVLYQKMVDRNYKKCNQLYDLKIVGEKFDKLINLYSRIK